MSQSTPCTGPRALAKANVTIALKGLAISNYNEDRQRWETAFLCHVPDHNLQITVNKCRAGELLSSNSYPIGGNEKIHIRSQGAVPQKPRHESGDDKDISRLIDFSSAAMYNGSVNFKLDAGQPVTFLAIENAVFYTKTLTKNTYNVLKNNSAVIESINLGSVAGADIIVESGGQTEIYVDSNPALIAPLKAEDDIVYEIIFDNICSQPPDGSNDFDYYCECFSMTDTFTIAVAQIEDEGEKRPPCNSVLVSELGNIKSLEDLLGA